MKRNDEPAKRRNITMTIRSHQYTLPALTLAAAALCCNVSTAADTNPFALAVGDVPTKTVKFAELDVTERDGAQVLYRRLQHAAKIVCRRYSSRDPQRAAMERKCVKTAVANAVHETHQSQVVALHRATTQRKGSG
jgi:UrcA family protein